MYKYFGTDGFRGTANVELMPEHAFKIGRFLGWYFSKKSPAKILIGKDTRRSSYMFESAFGAELQLWSRRLPFARNHNRKCILFGL